jgi:exodeoxyribonuclease VII small subunit
MTSQKKEIEEPFEEILRKLEKNVASLESGDVPLEEALKLFEEGIKLSRVLTERLASAEESVKQLIEKGQGEFDLEDIKGQSDAD